MYFILLLNLFIVLSDLFSPKNFAWFSMELNIGSFSWGIFPKKLFQAVFGIDSGSVFAWLLPIESLGGIVTTFWGNFWGVLVWAVCLFIELSGDFSALALIVFVLIFFKISCRSKTLVCWLIWSKTVSKKILFWGVFKNISSWVQRSWRIAFILFIEHLSANCWSLVVSLKWVGSFGALNFIHAKVLQTWIILFHNVCEFMVANSFELSLFINSSGFLSNKLSKSSRSSFSLILPKTFNSDSEVICVSEKRTLSSRLIASLTEPSVSCTMILIASGAIFISSFWPVFY